VTIVNDACTNMLHLSLCLCLSLS